MQNRQKFQRATLVSLLGQINSPSMTITKILRTITGDDETGKIISFAYECSWWDVRKKCFHREVFEEDTLVKVREKPKI
jgi:uncharacterized protein YodC (DUF2158 family)